MEASIFVRERRDHDAMRALNRRDALRKLSTIALILVYVAIVAAAAFKDWREHQAGERAFEAAQAEARKEALAPLCERFSWDRPMSTKALLANWRELCFG